MADLEAVAADAVAVGEAMALAITGAGAVVLCVGQTSTGGWDGVSEKSGGLRVAIRPSGVRRLRAVSCGQGHCVVLGHGGEVFAWGSNDYGQTGVGSESDEEPSPREVPGLSGKGVGQLACGAVHTVALCEGGAVLGAGSNRQGQLGIRGVGELRRAGALEWRLCSAVNGAGADAGAAGGEVVLQIVCGAFHTLALTGGGAVWACGANSHGQLGLGMLADCRAPERVPLPPSAGRAAQACAGRRHSGILSERGGVRFPLERCVAPASITQEKHLLACTWHEICGRAPGMKFADRGSRCCCAATTRSGSWVRPARRSARNSRRALPSAAWRWSRSSPGLTSAWHSTRQASREGLIPQSKALAPAPARSGPPYRGRDRWGYNDDGELGLPPCEKVSAPEIVLRPPLARQLCPRVGRAPLHSAAAPHAWPSFL
jgi:hypothetical protein